MEEIKRKFLPRSKFIVFFAKSSVGKLMCVTETKNTYEFTNPSLQKYNCAVHMYNDKS